MAESAGSLYGAIDAETGDESQFDSVVEGGTNTFNATIGSKNNGSYGFDLQFLGSTGTAYGQIGFTDNDTEWHRFYINLKSGMVLAGTYTYLYLLKIYDGGVYVGGVGVRSTWQADHFPREWVLDYKTSGSFSTTGLSTGAWIRVELKYVRDGSVGGVLLKIDGTQVAINMSNDSSAHFVDTARYGDVDGNDAIPNGEYVYLDDIRGNDIENGAYVDAGGSGTVGTLLSGLFSGKLFKRLVS